MPVLREATTDIATPVRIVLFVIAVLALSGLGVFGLKVWTNDERDGREDDERTAFRRTFAGLMLSTACFMVVAVMAVLGLRAVIGT